jgi:outer membrane protein assembly factor BamB
VSIVDNNAYLGAGENVISIDLTTHKVGWTFKTGDLVLSSPAVAGNAVFAGSNDGHIYAINRSTGEKLWDIATGDKVSSSPAVVNGVVYVGSEDGTLYAIN